MAGTTFTWKHALQLHSSLSPFDSPVPVTHSGFHGAPRVSWQRRNIGGLLVTLYGIDELPTGTAEVTCLWLLHGRGDTQDSMAIVAGAFLTAWAERRKRDRRGHPAIAIAFDQRNHGSRMIDDKASVSWRQGNRTHGQDMFSLFGGTASDVSFLLDHLPNYLPVRFVRNVGVGISLGAHALWQLVVGEPRITIAIIALGTPDYARLMTHRAIRSKLSTTENSDPVGAEFVGSPDFPPSLVALVKKADAAGIFLDGLDVDRGYPVSESDIRRLRPMVQQRLAGKKLLCLRGEKDGLVPMVQSQPFHEWLAAAVDRRRGWAGDMEIEFTDIVDAEARHEVSKKLRAEAESWLCEVLANTDDAPSNERSSLL